MTLLDASNQPVATPSDLVVSIVSPAGSLAPRRLTGKIAAGTSATSLGGLRLADSGSFTLQVTAGSYAAAPTLAVAERPFTGAKGPEVALDAGGPGLTGFSFADVAALDSQAACAFTDQRVAGMSHVFVNGSLDDGATWKGARRADRAPDATDAWDAAVALDGQGVVVAAWCDARASETGAVYANVSLDGGQTFGASDVRVDAASARTNLCAGTRAACAGGRLFVAWSDERDATLGATVWLARSLDQGKTWSEQRLDNHVAGASPWRVSGALSLVACGDDVSVLWIETQSGATSVVVASSQDGGASFARTALLGPLSANVLEARLVGSGGALHAAWRDDRTGAATAIATRASTDGGATWSAEVAVPLGATKAQVSSLSLAAAGSRVVVCAAAQDTGGSRLDPVIARSTDGGATFTVTGSIGQGADSARNPALAAQGATAFATWSETAYATGERGTLSTDGGATFAAPATVSGSTAADGLFGPARALAVGSSSFYVVWEESRGSPSSPSHLWLVVAR